MQEENKNEIDKSEYIRLIEEAKGKPLTNRERLKLKAYERYLDEKERIENSYAYRKTPPEIVEQLKAKAAAKRERKRLKNMEP